MLQNTGRIRREVIFLLILVSLVNIVLTYARGGCVYVVCTYGWEGVHQPDEGRCTKRWSVAHI